MGHSDLYDKYYLESKEPNKPYYLDKPEIAFLYKFENRLKSMRMLDIGVGGGRTTFYFADLVSSYVGIDISETLVELCQNKFPNKEFLTCDATDMEIFEDDSFDLVFFSFNGIDRLSHEYRLKVLREIRRVCKKDSGTFFFSSHNLNYIPKLFSLEFSFDPIITFLRLKNLLLMRLKNKKIEYNKGYSLVYSTAFDFELPLYWISPEEQIRQLHEVGFKNVSMYSLNSGTNIQDVTIDDHWIHYLCEP